MTSIATSSPPVGRDSAILDAVLVVLSRDGIGGVTMRGVAREAGVSLGLANYHFSDKESLIAAALERIGELDLHIVNPDDDDAVHQLQSALRRVGEPQFLDPAYLALRLQLWSLAHVHPTFAEINRSFQQRYRDQLTSLIVAAVEGLSVDEASERAGEILVVQNGIWLTAAIIDEPEAIARSLDRCERIAFAPPIADRSDR